MPLKISQEIVHRQALKLRHVLPLESAGSSNNLSNTRARARARGGAREGIGLPQQSKSHPFAVPERVWISF